LLAGYISIVVLEICLPPPRNTEAASPNLQSWLRACVSEEGWGALTDIAHGSAEATLADAHVVGVVDGPTSSIATAVRLARVARF